MFRCKGEKRYYCSCGKQYESGTNICPYCNSRAYAAYLPTPEQIKEECAKLRLKSLKDRKKWKPRHRDGWRENEYIVVAAGTGRGSLRARST